VFCGPGLSALRDHGRRFVPQALALTNLRNGGPVTRLFGRVRGAVPDGAVQIELLTAGALEQREQLMVREVRGKHG
jgi:hypothetical protein